MMKNQNHNNNKKILTEINKNVVETPLKEVKINYVEEIKNNKK